MGTPPLEGVVVNVADEPRQNGFVRVEMVMLTGNNGLTDTGYWMLDAGLLVAQGSEDDNVQETRSPFTGMKEYVSLLGPTFTPLIFH
jgi:hypothetical protein